MARSGGPSVADLTPYVPRLALEWDLDAAGASWRAIDGTLVFLDISGFTKMSERLERFGPVGAEEVTDALNGTFSRLLDVAYSYGGGLLKFGGDALLVFFSGPDHAARATSAAWGMREDLRRRGRITTAAGFVTLRMSVGVHSGEFHFFLVGSSHRELIVAGPAATVTVLMEHDANAGEVLISAATAAVLEPRSIGGAKGAGYLLRRPPLAAPAEPIARREAITQPAGHLPTAIRAHVVAGGHEAEHRQATVAFVHFHGTDEALAEHGPAAVADGFVALIDTVTQIADRYELGFIGSDVDVNGGKIILTAGAPFAIGSPDEAILRAARDLIDAELPIKLSVGVHRGAVFAGDVGPDYRRTYTVMGDAVNTAARVMAHAEAGEVLATPGVVDHSAAEFETHPIAPFAGKGKKLAISAARVGPIVGTRTTGDGDTPMVGRDKELDALLDWLAEARQGHGAVVEVVGPPGMGKTRLLDEFRAAGGDTPWLVTLCEQYEQTTPYFALRSLLRALTGVAAGMAPAQAEATVRARLRVLRPDLEPWLPLLAVPLDIAVPSTPEVDRLDEARRKARTHEVIAAFLAGAVPGPAVWVVDDAQWLDETSADAIRYLVASIDARSWLVCLARWPDTESLGSGSITAEVVLSPLGSRDAIELARAAAPTPLLPDAAEAVTERAGGSPLFLKELARAVAERGTEETNLPSSVEALVATRIDELAPDDRGLLCRAAVIGRRGSVALLERVAIEGGAISPAAFRRMSAFLTRDGDEFAFRHGVVREVAYGRLSFRRRRELHEGVGTALEARGSDPEQLSLHFFEAQAFERAWDYSRQAAQRAAGKFAFAEAVAFWRRSLACARRLPEPPGAEAAKDWSELGYALTRSGHLFEAPAAYAAARRLTADPAEGCRLCLFDGEIKRLTGNPTAAIRWFKRGLRMIEGIDGPEAAKQRCRLTAACAMVSYQRGRYLDAMRLAERSRVEAERFADYGGMGHAWNLLLLAGTAAGDPASYEYGRQALAAFETAGVLQMQGEVLNNLGDAAGRAGRWAEALELLGRSRVVLLQSGDVVSVAVVENNLAEILSDQGRYDEARPLIDSALDTFRATRHQFTPFAEELLGRMLTRTGHLEQAAELLAVAAANFAAIGIADEVAKVEALQAERLLYQDEFAAVVELTARIFESSPAAVRPLVHRLRGSALASMGDLVEARTTLLEGLELARHLDNIFECALLLGTLAWCLTEAGRPDEARAYETESAQLLARLGVRIPPTPSFNPGFVIPDPSGTALLG